MRYLKAGLKKRPDHWAAYELLGNIHATNKEYREAVTAYRTGLKYQPDSFRFNYFLGYTYLQTKKFKLAEEFLSKAYRVDPGNNRTWLPLAQIYTYKGQPEKALEFYNLRQKNTKEDASPGGL